MVLSIQTLVGHLSAQSFIALRRWFILLCHLVSKDQNVYASLLPTKSSPDRVTAAAPTMPPLTTGLATKAVGTTALVEAANRGGIQNKHNVAVSFLSVHFLSSFS